MPDLLQTDLLSAEDAARQAHRITASNGIRYATLGHLLEPHTSTAEIARLVGAVPAGMASALTGSTYVFVPLALSGARLSGDDAADAAFQTGDRTLIALVATPDLVDKAICHRNSTIAGAEYVFLSAQLHNDRFALAFEFCINIAHDLVDIAGMPAGFGHLLTEQAGGNLRGETSIDAWENRSIAFGPQPAAPSSRSHTEPPATPLLPNGPITPDQKQKALKEYMDAAFADAVAIYLLSLFLDFDYADLREREYPLLAPAALAARLRAIHALYPPNPAYNFAILYRRRG